MTETIQSVENGFKSTDQLQKEANSITKRNTLYAAGAGLIPIPIADAALILGIQLNMIRSISKLYNVPFKENIVKSIIGSLVGSIGTASVVKSIPVVGSVLGGFTLSASAAAATYALGRVFTQHFDQGGTLLDFDPVKSREYFEKEYEAGRMYVSDVNAVEEEVAKEKKGMFGNMFTNKKKEQEKAERAELLKSNTELTEAVAALRKEIEAIKNK